MTHPLTTYDGSANNEHYPSKDVASVSFFIILVIYILYFGFTDQNPLRPLIYILPATVAFELTLRGSLRLKPYLLSTLIIYLTFFFPYSANNTEAHTKEAVFLILSLTVATIAFKTPKWFPTYFLFSCLITVAIRGLINGLSLSEIKFGLASSNIGTETSLGLITPLVAIFLFTKGQRVLGFLAIIVTVLMFKRIGLVALLTVLLIDTLQYTYFKKLKISHSAATTVKISIILTTATIGLFPTEFYQIISNIYYNTTGNYVSPDHLSSGRYFALSVFTDNLIENLTTTTILFGNGAGYSTYFLGESSLLLDKHYPLLHNDFLRMFSDYGLIGLFVGVLFLLKLAIKDRLSSNFSTYTSILFMTDNVLTYFVFWLVFIALLRAPHLDNKFY
ncbi:hypothetical protein BVC71_02790 [Marivivens niveibacter]|uniref:O-antigen polymerase n=2 Tax=Marivivens niveibacter TaxID=1930667 RepID=A0A251X208_9RHOB|nr:hypothetical protein BVC71_02790 [Marivivens niveibacter]